MSDAFLGRRAMPVHGHDAPRAEGTSTDWPTASPCIKVCRIDVQGRCFGCGRTLDEIARWSAMSLDERRAVNARVGFRGHGDNR
jgi:predicted Fe-S protein YdhL (DUF1289 family)